MKEHLISVIIPSYNQGRYIEKTILSVINQSYKNFELIIIDGESVDNTMEIISKYQNSITYWVSEKDSGQSDAINKGFKTAKGEYVTWLNSDDILLPGVLKELNFLINKNPKCKWFCGNLIWIDKFDKVVNVGKAEPYSEFFAKRGFFNAAGPSSFMHKKLLEKYGYLNEDFHYMMDTELWSRFIVNNISFIRIKQYCWALRIHEEAKMSGHMFSNSVYYNENHPSNIQKEKEANYISNNYFSNKCILLKRIYQLYKLLFFSFYRRIIDRKYLGKDYMKIKKL
jgi:glycosyltransferase involved in cell wall biosynthesis